MTALVVDNVSVRHGPHLLLDEFALAMKPSDVVALIGPNGAGKTTLIRCILGRVRPTQGRVLLDGIETSELSARCRAGLVAHLSQQTPSDDAVPVLEYVASARYRHSENRSASESAATVALARVDAAGLAARHVGSLSGGERQRVALAALLAQESKMLLLDEPANHLDPVRQARSYALLGELQNQGLTMLIVTHDVNLLTHLQAPGRVRIVGMKRGRSAFELPFGSDELCDALADLYGMKMQRFTGRGQSMIAPAREQ